jgi:PAB-dependent poly(A)-specific ribonuclease subunit 3
MYFMPSNHQMQHVPEYSYYTAPPSHLVQGRGTQIQSLYPNPEIAEDLTKSNLLSLAQLPQDSTAVHSEVDHYHSLFPLEAIDATPPDRQGQRTFGYASTCYKAVDARDGLVYVLRRIHGFKLSSTKAVNEAAKWKKIRHPNIVSLREMFTTKNFGDNSLVFVYDYHAGAETLLAHHIQSEGGEGLNGSPIPVTEGVLWQYIAQLTSALQAIHSNKLAARFIDLSKVLVSRNHR